MEREKTRVAISANTVITSYRECVWKEFFISEMLLFCCRVRIKRDYVRSNSWSNECFEWHLSGAMVE